MDRVPRTYLHGPMQKSDLPHRSLTFNLFMDQKKRFFRWLDCHFSTLPKKEKKKATTCILHFLRQIYALKNRGAFCFKEDVIAYSISPCLPTFCTISSELEGLEQGRV